MSGDGFMTTREALNGSEADRDFWKWERQQEALEMSRVFERLGHKEVAAGWRREYERYTAMLKPKK